MRSRNLNRIF